MAHEHNLYNEVGKQWLNNDYLNYQSLQQSSPVQSN